MEINPIAPADRQQILRYDAAGFRVSGIDYRGSVIVLLDRTLAWPVTAMDELSAAALKPVVEASPRLELLLIGCGRRGAMVPHDIRQAMRAAGISIEPMDTGAACRTYNVLMNDGRLVAAALIALGA